jgi:hypothetical protein
MYLNVPETCQLAPAGEGRDGGDQAVDTRTFGVVVLAQHSGVVDA